MITDRPARLRGFDYIGIHAYFLTICTDYRRKTFLDDAFTGQVRDQLLHTAAAYRFAIIAFVFMPDHVHILLEGLAPDSDFKKFVAMFKQRSGFAYRRSTGRRLWQENYYEHVLRSGERYPAIVGYILGNPIRAGLCERLDDYRFAGSDGYSIEELGDYVQMNRLPWE